MRRLNERGSALLLQPELSHEELGLASRLFSWAQQINPGCSLCYQASRALTPCVSSPVPYTSPTPPLHLPYTYTSPTPPLHLPWHQNLGDVMLRLDRPVEAETSLRAQLSLLPRDSDAHYALGQALRAQGRTAEAAASYTAALDISPRDHESLLGLAACHAELEQPALEADAYRRALEIKPASDVRIWLNLGVAYSVADEVEEAVKAFRSACEVCLA